MKYDSVVFLEDRVSDFFTTDETVSILNIDNVKYGYYVSAHGTFLLEFDKPFGKADVYYLPYPLELNKGAPCATLDKFFKLLILG